VREADALVVTAEAVTPICVSTDAVTAEAVTTRAR
jgi:hypothetical protein